MLADHVRAASAIRQRYGDLRTQESAQVSTSKLRSKRNSNSARLSQQNSFGAKMPSDGLYSALADPTESGSRE